MSLREKIRPTSKKCRNKQRQLTHWKESLDDTIWIPGSSHTWSFNARHPKYMNQKVAEKLKLICIKSLSHVTKRDLANIRPNSSHDILRPCVIWLLAAYFCNLTWHHFFSLLMAHQYRASSASNAPGFFLCRGLHTCSPKHFANSYRSFRCLHIDHVLRQGFPD